MTGPVARFGRRGVALILIGVAWLGFDREGLHLRSMEVNALIRLATQALETA